MATGRVQYVLTGDATALAASLEDIKKRNEQLEASLERMQRKQKQTADEGATAFKELAGAVGSVVSVSAIVSDVMESLRQKVRGVVDEIGRVRSVGGNFSESMAQLVSGGAGGMSPGAAARSVLDVAGSSALGANAPQLIAQAVQAISRNNYSGATTTGILQQTSGLLQLAPGANAGNLARGVSALVDSGMNPQQAANMMLGMPGSVTSLEDRAKLVDELQPFAAGAGMDMTRTLGLAGYVSNVLSDESGGQTANVIKVLYDKLVTNRTAAEGKLGVQLGGDLIQNLRIAGGSPNLMSMMDEGAFGLGKGPASRLALQNLFSADGLQSLEASIAAAGAATGGDRVGTALQDLRASVPGFAENERVLAAQSKSAVQRLGAGPMMEMGTGMEVLREQLRRSGASEREIDFAIETYRLNRRSGGSDEEARFNAIRSMNSANIPLASGLAAGVMAIEANRNPNATVMDPLSGELDPQPRRDDAELMRQNNALLQKISDSNQAMATERSRPLENIHHN